MYSRASVFKPLLFGFEQTVVNRLLSVIFQFRFFLLLLRRWSRVWWLTFNYQLEHQLLVHLTNVDHTCVNRSESMWSDYQGARKPAHDTWPLRIFSLSWGHVSNITITHNHHPTDHKVGELATCQAPPRDCTPITWAADKLSLGATCQELVWLHWVYQDLLSRGAFACKLAQRVFWEIEWNQLWYFSYLTSKQHWTPAGGDLWPSSKLKQQRGCWKCSSWVKAQGLVAQHV